MKRQNIKKALVEIGYEPDSIKSLLCGRALPSMSKAIKLRNEHNIPLDAWIDIKSFINSKENGTKQVAKESNTNELKKVS